MKTLHRLYTWALFPFVATLYIIAQLLQFLINLLMSFTYDVFFHTVTLPESAPANIPAPVEYLYRIMMAFVAPAMALKEGMKALNHYKF